MMIMILKWFMTIDNHIFKFIAFNSEKKEKSNKNIYYKIIT